MGKKVSFLVAAILVMVVLGGCAAGPNDGANVAGPSGVVAGFWAGLWHGMISGFILFLSLFNPHLNIYEVHNSGWLYNLGFLMGVGSSIVSGAGARVSVDYQKKSISASRRKRPSRSSEKR